jgi:hypothetical protein
MMLLAKAKLANVNITEKIEGDIKECDQNYLSITQKLNLEIFEYISPNNLN